MIKTSTLKIIFGRWADDGERILENKVKMTNRLKAPGQMASIPEPSCYLCDVRGVLLHAGLSDQWIGVPGNWDMKRCPNPDCGLYWLDPMPSIGEIGKAYCSYFTHSDYDHGGERKIDWLSFFLLKVHKPLHKLFEHAVGLRKIEKEWRRKVDLMFLDDVPPGGRLLDVGCGKGDLLARLLRRGWSVEGLEVDAEAAAHACMNYGLNVHVGALEGHRFPDHVFDVVTMNHVIEHVHDPISLVRECLRVLKPGGRLILATPNSQGLGCKRFGRHWSHLDPPRHLYLFTKKNLAECVSKAGGHFIDTWCVPGYAEGGAIRVSIEREAEAAGNRRWEFSKWLEASYLKALAYYLFFVKKDDEVGEEIFLTARKDKQ